VLRIPLNDPYISVGPAESTKEYGLKEPASQLLAQNSAIAGINADFFGLDGSYSAGFGPVFKNNKLISIAGSTNETTNQFAALFINSENLPFISFLKTNIRFFNDGVENIQIHSINKITDMVYPVAITAQAMNDTSALDKRFPGLLKIVVQGMQITYISAKGETVSVPQDGYIVAIQEKSADYFGQFFKVGQRAVLRIEPMGVDFSRVKSSVGGGGLILQNGQSVAIGEIVTGDKRLPRSAIGINRERTELILVEVDGRSHSIGANHDEMGWIMKRYGAYDAMHLDGGGSSTMVIKDPGTGKYDVVNNVSDGSERKVINALGIYNNAPISVAEQIRVETSKSRLLLGESVNISTYGFDAYFHKLDINPNEVSISFNDDGGKYENGVFKPGRQGVIAITAQYNGLTAQTTLNVITLAELKCSQSSIKLNKGESVRLGFSGIGTDGEAVSIVSGVSYAVEPKSLGTAESGQFTAQSDGTGYLQCTVSGISTYIPIYIGDTGDAAVKLPAAPSFKDPWRSDPNAVSGQPAITIQGAAEAAANAIARFEAVKQSNILHISMNAEKGGFISTDNTQWRRFAETIEFTGAANIVIETDTKPQNFSEKQEYELFHDVLAQYARAGKRIIVVSKQGYSTTTIIREGVHYINLGALQFEDKTLNENYRVFRIYSLGDTFTYTLTK
jgi:hypothetical protein